MISPMMRNTGLNGGMMMGSREGGAMCKGRAIDGGRIIFRNEMNESYDGKNAKKNPYAVVDNPFRQFSNTNQSQQQQQYNSFSQPRILNILLEHIILPCCNNPI